MTRNAFSICVFFVDEEDHTTRCRDDDIDFDDDIEIDDDRVVDSDARNLWEGHVIIMLMM